MSKELFDYYDKFSDDELIKYRARGLDGLSLEAQNTIYEILKNRGISPPEIPSKEIDIGEIREHKTSKLQIAMRFIILIIVIVVFRGILKQLNLHLSADYALIVLPIVAIAYLIYCIYRNDRIKNSPLEETVGSDGFTELMLCASKGNISRIQELISFGANVNLQDASGATAIMYAIDKNQIATIKLLLSNGADLTLKTKQGRDCLDLAKLSKSNEIFEILTSK